MSIIQLINRSPLLVGLSVLLWFGAAHVAQAKDYMVEVILFENNDAVRAKESLDYQRPREMKTGAETWQIEPSMLLDQLDALKNSSNYEVRHIYSWGQESLPYQDSATFEIYQPDAQGFIKIYADQLLFANIDIDYDGYRMQEKRRLKLDEKHFFDHPKFGLLLQVSRLEQKDEQAPRAVNQP